MEFLPPKRLRYANGLSRLILKLCQPLEKTAIATRSLKNKIKSVLCNTIQELPVTIEEIRNKAKMDKYMTEKRKQINDQ